MVLMDIFIFPDLGTKIPLWCRAMPMCEADGQILIRAHL